MSVQRANYNNDFISMCPIVLNSREAILTFKTASIVLVPHNVNSSFASCHPTDNSLQYVYNGKVNTCCESNIAAGKTY